MTNVQQLSDFQEQVLAVLPIPSAILSIIGSAAIIYIAIKQKRIIRSSSWNPYTRLLVAMSSCDILFSITIAIATFLRPRETSSRTWAFGNDATCSFVGFSQQLWSISAILYNAMLSFYFLLTTRFGMKNSEISKCTEPVMHLLAIGYPLVTATVGSALGVYGESAIALSCWVSNYKCDDNGDNCISKIIATFYYAIPVLGVFASLLINNTIIFLFVRRHTIRGKRQQRSTEMIGSTTSLRWDESKQWTNNSDESCNPVARGEASLYSKKDKKSQTQARRLRLVSTQSLLFVLSFFVCNLWSGILALAEGAAKTDNEELEMLVKYYPICILQSFFLPLQGFFNMIVYIRPRFILIRHEFPDESRVWAVRKVFRGDRLLLRPIRAADDGQRLPKIEGKRNAKDHGGRAKQSIAEGVVPSDHEPATTPVNRRRRRDIVSSLTASHGDFDLEVDGEETDLAETVEVGNSTNATTRLFQEPKESSTQEHESLEVISELSVSIFDSITMEKSVHQEDHMEESHQESRDTLIPSHRMVPTPEQQSPSSSRWNSRSSKCRSYPPPPPPQETTCSSQLDSPIKLPVRKNSPTAPPKGILDLNSFVVVSGDSPLSPPKRWLSIPSLMDEA